MDSEFGVLMDGQPGHSFRRPRGLATRAQSGLTGGVASFSSAAISEEELLAQAQIQEFQRSLLKLAAAFHEDYRRDLDPNSRAGLDRFMRRQAMRVRPSIGAESSGQLIATWRVGDDVLSLQFLDRLRFNFAMTTHEVGGPVRLWGEAFALTFFDEFPTARRFAVT